MLDSLRALPNVSEIRQCGYIAGIEIQEGDGKPFPWQNQVGARVCLAARRHGLLTRPILDTIVLIPPLCTTQEQLERAINAIRRAIREVCEKPSR